METAYFVGFSTAMVCILLLCIVIGVILSNRIDRLHDLCNHLLNDLAEKAPPKQLEKALATAEGARDRLDTALLEMGKFRDGVHSEMQRFYAIMRRREKTQVAEAQAEAESQIPDEVDVSALKPGVPEGEAISKAELRRQAREAGL